MSDTKNRMLNYQSIFHQVENVLREEHASKKMEIVARHLLSFANLGGHGYYSSPVLEKYYTEKAARLKSESDCGFSRGTCLLVFSYTYMSGGHTRVAERWIEADKDRRYSVVCTGSDTDEIPPRLRRAVAKSGGVVFHLAGNEEDAKAIELRKISQYFESIVLFTHMDDPLPLSAYGTCDFARPVGFYNHADHRFWLGVSIADCVAELRDWGLELSRRLRGVKRNMVVSVPLDFSPISMPNREEQRKKFGIPIDAKVVLTVGREVKYAPVEGKSVLPALEAILQSGDDVYVVGIGMKLENLHGWRECAERYRGRFHTYGTVPHEQLVNLYAVADIVLDSYPMGGITALADALKCGCCILSCMESVEWIEKGPALCKNADEMAVRAIALLSEPGERLALHQTEYELLVHFAGHDAFKRNLDAFFKDLLACKHMVRDFVSVPSVDVSRAALFLDNHKCQLKSLEVPMRLIGSKHYVLLKAFYSCCRVKQFFRRCGGKLIKLIKNH